MSSFSNQQWVSLLTILHDTGALSLRIALDFYNFPLVKTNDDD